MRPGHEQPELLEVDFLFVIAVLHFMVNIDRVERILDVILGLRCHGVLHHDVHTRLNVEAALIFIHIVVLSGQVRWHSDLHRGDNELSFIIPQLEHDFEDVTDEHVTGVRHQTTTVINRGIFLKKLLNFHDLVDVS